MADFKWHIESKRKGGATSQANYIWGLEEFSSRADVVATGCGNLPAWCYGNPVVFFAASDCFERRNGSACRHLVISLPRELNLADWIRLVENLIACDIGPKPYQYAIHVNAVEHPHAHIVYSDRVPDGFDRPANTFFSRANIKTPEAGGCKKDSGGQSPTSLRISIIKRKELWADLQNAALKAGGHDARVDHRSQKAEGGKDPVSE